MKSACSTIGINPRRVVVESQTSLQRAEYQVGSFYGDCTFGELHINDLICDSIRLLCSIITTKPRGLGQIHHNRRQK